MSLPRYPEYKDTGVEWIGKIPAHWDPAPLKRHVRLITDRATSRRRAIGLENVEGWSGRLIDTDGDFEGDGVAFEPGDVLFGKLRPYLAKVLAPDFPGEAVGDFHVLRPRGTLLPRYIQYQMLQSTFISVVDGSTFGSKMPRASWEALGGMLVMVPPSDEQAAIASFLDYETDKIDALIAEQEKLLALLDEKRQATISHAVTRGLDPNAPMKDSGIPWLGEVPAQWDLPPLYLRYSSELGKMLDTDRITGRYLVSYLRNVDVQWDAINYENLPAMDIKPDEIARYTVRDGDLLVCEGGEVGRTAVVNVGNSVIGYQKALHRLRALSEAECPRYMFYIFSWASKAGAFAGEGQATIAHLTGEQLRKYRFPRPSKVEQEAIAEFLDDAIAKLAKLSEEAESGIALLKERRNALIAAAVTGQMNVRDTSTA